jgi:hypothetical protein
MKVETDAVGPADAALELQGVTEGDSPATGGRQRAFLAAAALKRVSRRLPVLALHPAAVEEAGELDALLGDVV